MFTLNTLRLNLRQIRLNDADFILELLNSAGWKKYIGDREVNSIPEAEDYIRSKVIPSYEKFGFGFYMMVSRTDQIRVGICGLVRRTGLEDVDLGFALLPQFEGRGYALEAAQATLEYGLEIHALGQIVAITSKNNLRSRALLKKLGMIYKKMVRLPEDDEELMLFSSSVSQCPT
jgi:RimJ/RimL family protein N-acetyltransferase